MKIGIADIRKYIFIREYIFVYLFIWHDLCQTLNYDGAWLDRNLLNYREVWLKLKLIANLRLRKIIASSGLLREPSISAISLYRSDLSRTYVQDWRVIARRSPALRRIIWLKALPARWHTRGKAILMASYLFLTSHNEKCGVHRSATIDTDRTRHLSSNDCNSPRCVDSMCNAATCSGMGASH